MAHYQRARPGNLIVSIVLERRLLVNLYRISMQEIHISMEEVKNYYAGRHLISMEERILPRQFEY